MPFYSVYRRQSRSEVTPRLIPLGKVQASSEQLAVLLAEERWPRAAAANDGPGLYVSLWSVDTNPLGRMARAPLTPHLKKRYAKWAKTWGPEKL